MLRGGAGEEFQEGYGGGLCAKKNVVRVPELTELSRKNVKIAHKTGWKEIEEALKVNDIIETINILE